MLDTNRRGKVMSKLRAKGPEAANRTMIFRPILSVLNNTVKLYYNCFRVLNIWGGGAGVHKTLLGQCPIKCIFVHSHLHYTLVFIWPF